MNNSIPSKYTALRTDGQPPIKPKDNKIKKLKRKAKDDRSFAIAIGCIIVLTVFLVLSVILIGIYQANGDLESKILKTAIITNFRSSSSAVRNDCLASYAPAWVCFGVSVLALLFLIYYAYRRYNTNETNVDFKDNFKWKNMNRIEWSSGIYIALSFAVSSWAVTYAAAVPDIFVCVFMAIVGFVVATLFYLQYYIYHVNNNIMPNQNYNKITGIRTKVAYFIALLFWVAWLTAVLVYGVIGYSSSTVPLGFPYCKNATGYDGVVDPPVQVYILLACGPVFQFVVALVYFFLTVVDCTDKNKGCCKVSEIMYEQILMIVTTLHICVCLLVISIPSKEAPVMSCCPKFY
jgi:hypothetical protein